MPAEALSRSARVIRRYPNRRLYDTQTSGYVSLAQIKAMVLAFEAFVVLDSKTGDDVTRSMLLQLLLEEESNGVPLLSKDALANMIRFYGQGSPVAVQAWFERSVGLMVEAQSRAQARTVKVGGDWVSPLLQQSQQLMAQWQNGLGALNPFVPAHEETAHRPTAEPAKSKRTRSA